ncbi:MAG: YjfB family protein [Lachnospiraceae bacterium]|nr:YjfB family protein [Lachnospiraceae bacterium]
MDLGVSSLSPALNLANSGSTVATKMLAKAMDQNEILGQGMVAMLDSAAMERSVNPSVGSKFDLSV